MKKLLIPFLLLVLLVGSLALRQNEPNLGIPVPVTVAVYEDSLQASISSSASSLTLVRGTDKRGNNLAARVSAVIDEGSSSEEFMIVTCAATACTINSRGLDPINPTTEVAALKFPHRRGASFKITDYPQLAILSRIINGDERFPNHVGLAQAFVAATASTTDFATKAYVDSVGAGGFTAANVAANKGLYVLGTSPETVGVYISATSSALKFAGINDSQLMLKLNGEFGITADGNLKLATSTNFTWTGQHTFSKATSTYLVVGSSNPTWPTTAGLWIGGNATSTGSVSAAEFCFSGANCFATKPPSVATSTVARIGTGATSLTTLQTYIIPAGPPAGTVYSLNAGYSKSGANGSADMAVLFNGISVFVSSTCGTAAAAGSMGALNLNIIFGAIAETNQEVIVNGICSGNAQGLPGSLATTTIKTNETHAVNIQGKAASGDTITLDGFSIIKY